MKEQMGRQMTSLMRNKVSFEKLSIWSIYEGKNLEQHAEIKSIIKSTIGEPKRHEGSLKRCCLAFGFLLSPY